MRCEIARLGPLVQPVVIEGETGAGKDVVARAIHLASGRGGSFVQVAGKEIPPSLLHSSVFGHERGAFSGAVERQLGVLERAVAEGGPEDGAAVGAGAGDRLSRDEAEPSRVGCRFG